MTKKKVWIHSSYLITFPLFALAFLALPIFKFGYWHQSELPVLVFNLFGSISFLWLFWGIKHYPKSITNLFKYPLVWTSGLIALISLILCPLQPVPLMSFWGTPQVGEGILFYLSMASISAVLTFQCRSPKVPKALILWALLAGTIISALTIIGSMESPLHSYRGWRWAPYYFPDYIAFIALAFFVYGAHLWEKKPRSTPLFFLTALLFAIVFYFCSNKSLWYGSILAFAGALSLKLLTRWHWRYIDLFPYLSIAAVMGFIISLGAASHLDLPIPGTLITRGFFVLYAFYNFAVDASWQDIVTMLIGKGWGGYQEFIAPNLFSVDSIEFYSGSGISKTSNRETIARAFFHSHNSLIESFSALGLFGFFLFLAKVYYLAKGLKPKFQIWGSLFILTFFLLGSFWFELTATVPFSLLAIVLLSKRCYPNILRMPPPLTQKILLVSSSVLVFVPLIPTAITTDAVTKIAQIKKGESYSGKMIKITQNKWVDFDHLLGFKRVAPMFNELTLAGTEAMKDKKISPKDVYFGNLTAADYLYSRRLNCGNLFAMMIPINIYGDLATNKRTKALFDSEPEILKKWEEITLSFNKCAPARSDMLLPLLNNLTLKGKKGRVKRLTKILLDRNPEDPVGLWFSGNLKLDNPRTAMEGISELKKAYKKGINRFVPISDALRRQLER